jgi:hypothetical protein
VTAVPYVMTTKRPYSREEVQALRGRGEHGPIANMITVSRRAVATLDAELPRLMREHGANGDWATSAVANLRESGGTVGPLPDGTVIEVERTLWSSLADEVGAELRWDPPTRDGDYLHAAQREELEAVLAAWNKQHGQT